MKIAETAEVLTKMAAYDRRTIGEADVHAWHDIIGDLERDDAMAAIRRHYSDSSEWLMPSTLRRLVAEIVKERSASPWAPGQYGVPRDQAHPELPTSGPLRVEDLPQAVRELLERLPPGDRAALHPRRAAWEREHRTYLRVATGEPNPMYDPTASRVSCDLANTGEPGCDLPAGHTGNCSLPLAGA